MKCIWRQIRRLSGGASDSLVQQIDTAKILQEIHAFLSQYPSTSWQSKQSDLPLRTVKTLLFHLAKAKQAQIIDDLDSICVPDDSEIKIYIVKLFKNGFQLTNNNSNNSVSNGNSSFGFGRNGSGSNIRQQGESGVVGSSDLDKVGQLRAIVRRISTEQTKESLRELYEFKQLNPDVDLNKYFEKSSGKLKHYITENLRRIEESEAAKLGANGRSPSKKSAASTNTFLNNDLSKVASVQKSQSRNVDDILKTIADWKSKTQLNVIDHEDNDENNIRSGVGGNNYGLNNDYSRMTSGVGNGSSGRLFQGSQQGHRMNTLNALEQNTTGEADHKAEKYQNIVKDLKKKYTRSRTEVSSVLMYYLGCCDFLEVFKCLCCNAAFE